MNVRILTLASNNEPEWLVPFCSEAVNAGTAKINLVMTLDRKGELFVRFFTSLFGFMLKGMTMPEAWVELAPQNPDGVPETPETIFSAGYGSLRLSV